MSGSLAPRPHTTPTTSSTSTRTSARGERVLSTRPHGRCSADGCQPADDAFAEEVTAAAQFGAEDRREVASKRTVVDEGRKGIPCGPELHVDEVEVRLAGPVGAAAADKQRLRGRVHGCCL